MFALILYEPKNMESLLDVWVIPIFYFTQDSNVTSFWIFLRFFIAKVMVIFQLFDFDFNTVIVQNGSRK